MKLIAALWLPLSLIASIASANPITVQIVETHFSTVLSTHAHDTDRSSEATNVRPLDEFLQGNGSGLTFAAGAADLFTVTARTSGLYDYTIGEEGGTSAIAYASSVVTFTPLLSETSTLTLDMPLLYGQYYFSDGLTRLIDLTTQTVAFEYFWGWRFGKGTLVDLPSQPTDRLNPAPYVIDMNWQADHTYQLILQLDTDADTDSQAITMRMNGLVATPEPAAIWTALLGIGMLMRHRVKADRAERD